MAQGAPQPPRSIDGAEVAQHDTKKSCWIVIDAQVYDVTCYLNDHPGGAAILLRQGGQDATAEFSKVHSPDILARLPRSCHVGPLKSSTSAQLKKPASASSSSSAAAAAAAATGTKPHITQCVVTRDFEDIAQHVLPDKAWIYASASSSAGLALQNNLDSWRAVSFRPRILRNVTDVNPATKILGQKSPFPFFVCPMGTLGNAHPEAEPELVRGLARRGVHAVISTASTRTAEEISKVAKQVQRKNTPASTLFFQYYLPTDRALALELIRKAKDAGYKGLWLTVDTPVLGKRTNDRRLQADEALEVGLADEAGDAQEDVGVADGQELQQGQNEAGIENNFAPRRGGRPRPGTLSSNTTWEDLTWIREAWQGPIVLKGVQHPADVKLAVECGVEGVLLSNHGGRQMGTAPSSLTTLLETRAYYPEVFGKIEIYLDGGLRDGADVLKAVCLGATAVGIGRPFLYSLASYGSKGVDRCVEILVEELETSMRLLGITSIDQARPDMVNASRLLNEMWKPEQSRL